jgi:excisionase family DNA binding protein
MKTELEESDIERIAKKVVEQITPMLKRNPESHDDKLMTVDEVASYLNVKKQFIYEKVHRREIPFRKAGKFSRFNRKHIDIWLLNPYHPDLSTYNLNHNGKEVKNSERVV